MTTGYYLGLISGTSIDAVDTALARIGQDLEIVQYCQYPINRELQSKARAIKNSSSLAEVTELDWIFGHLFAESALNIMQSAAVAPETVAAIGCHGQTVQHLPEPPLPRTWQIGDPNIIAYRTGITTVADFRRMDMAAHGQGAPLVPAFHQWQFQVPGQTRAILNIGGIANITVLPADPKMEIKGFDIGPGNALMDDWIRKHLDQNFDQDGQWAASGQAHEQLLRQLLDEVYFKAPPPKSTGKDFFNLQWLKHKLTLVPHPIQANDVQATLLKLTLISIRDAIERYAPACEELLICGGGTHNPLIMQGLSQLLPRQKVTSTHDYGINPDAVEATAFAWLAKRRLENQPGNLVSVTGADRQVVLGAIYSGRAC